MAALHKQKAKAKIQYKIKVYFIKQNKTNNID